MELFLTVFVYLQGKNEELTSTGVFGLQYKH